MRSPLWNVQRHVVLCRGSLRSDGPLCAECGRRLWVTGRTHQGGAVVQQSQSAPLPQLDASGNSPGTLRWPPGRHFDSVLETRPLGRDGGSLPHPPKPALFLLPPNARLSWAERAEEAAPPQACRLVLAGGKDPRPRGLEVFIEMEAGQEAVGQRGCAGGRCPSSDRKPSREIRPGSPFSGWGGQWARRMGLCARRPLPEPGTALAARGSYPALHHPEPSRSLASWPEPGCVTGMCGLGDLGAPISKPEGLESSF